MNNNSQVVSCQPIVHKIEELSCTQFTIGMLISSNYYVFTDTKVGILADELSRNDKIYAVAVVDKNKKSYGVIIRKDLFDILGTRFGRELNYNKTADEVMQKVKQFNYNMHIFECAKAIEKDLLTGVQDHYLLEDENDCFKGIFSTRDMLIFLSKLNQQDIEQAKRIIERILKKDYYVRTKRLTIGIKNVMAQGVGGDFYMVIPFKKSNQHIIVVCDVSGKGIAASMITTLLNGMMSIYDFETHDLETFLIHLNNYIFTNFEGEKFVTSAFMHVDEDKELLTLYDFGHSLTYLYRNDTIFKLSLKEINFPMGIQKINTLNFGKTKLNSGDTILTITDGCIEQRNKECAAYGVQGITQFMKENYNGDVQKFLDLMVFDINNFRDTYPQQDDMTIACIKYE